MIRRRELLTLIGGAAAWPVVARAQQSEKRPTIGFLGTTSSQSWSPWVTAFVQRLRELGWNEGSTVAIEYRWAEGRNQRFTELATEFVRLKVDVIVTAGGAVLAAKQATTDIPIVFAVAADPIGGGFVSNLARPGGNVTGLSLQAPDVSSKRLGLLRELLPSARRLTVLANAGYPASVHEMNEVQTAASALGFEVTRAEIRRSEDIVPAFEAHKSSTDALYIGTDPLIATNYNRINTLALAARLPTIGGTGEYVKTAGLMSYGPNYRDLFRRAAELVDKILRGTKPANIPVEQPTKFDLVINLITAKALGLTVPPTLLARANEVIE